MRCACCLLLAAVTAAGWVETAQAQGEAGLTVGFREVRMDRPGQVRVQISARRMEGELARPEGDSDWYRDRIRISSKRGRWRVCEKPGSL